MRWGGWRASPTQWTWLWVNSRVGDGQGGLACCSPCGHKESDTTERLNWNWNWWSRDHIAKIHWIIERAKEFLKNFCFIDYTKVFDCVDHHKLWKILQEMGIPDQLICVLRNLYTGQEAAIRTGHGKTDWFQIGKWVHQGCILSPCLFNLLAEYIMHNARLDEASTSWNQHCQEKYQ